MTDDNKQKRQDTAWNESLNAIKTLYQAFKILQRDLNEYVQEHINDSDVILEEAMKKSRELAEIEPFLNDELNKMAENPEYSTMTVDDFFKEEDENGNPVKSIWLDILEKAAQKAKLHAQKDINIPNVIDTNVSDIIMNIDKMNSTIWNMLETADKNGQLSMDVNMASEGEPPANVIYGIHFDDLGDNVSITKQLTPFDRRVYTAVSAIYNSGSDIFSIAQIHKNMGCTSEINKLQSQKIKASLTKMGAAHIYINNDHECSVHTKRVNFVYDSSLLPMECISAYINGALVESAIHLLREPPLTAFAKQRLQYTTFNVKLLQSPMNKTIKNLMLDDYLIERIAHMRNKKSVPRKLLYNTIYKNCGITTHKQKERAPEKIWSYLEYYGKCSYIKGFKKLSDGVEITL